jgi:hypothetical protein
VPAATSREARPATGAAPARRRLRPAPPLVQFDPGTGTSVVLGGDGLGCVYGLAATATTLFILNCDGKVGTFDPATGVAHVLSTTGVGVDGADVLP